MSLEQLLLYIFIIFSVSIVPGPSMMLAFRDGALYQIIGTLPSALGNMLASLIQALSAFLIFHSVVALTPEVQGIVQIIGACFICYIGYLFIKDGRKMRLTSEGATLVQQPVTRRFMEGFFIALFNPKAILFFVALFPQFTNDVDMGRLADILKTFSPIGIVALSCFLIYGMLGKFSRNMLDDAKLFGIVVPILGGAMIAITLYISASYFL